MFQLAALIPALISAVGAAAGGIAQGVGASEQAKADQEVAAKNREVQERLAREQALESMRQRNAAERQAGASAMEQALQQQAQTLQAGARDRMVARTGASKLIQGAFQGLR